MNDNVGLLLEGGGMRCAYTAGVLDLFLDKGVEFPVVATASAGALIGSSFISKQRERNYQILKNVGGNPKSVSFLKMIREKELFGMDYIFDKIPRELVPIDFDLFQASASRFIIGTTDINTGKPIYYNQYSSLDELIKITRASCSLPVLASSIFHGEIELMDGGVSDPIPIEPLLESGLKKNVVILTRNKGYIKNGTKLNWFFKRFFRNKPELIKLLRDRHLTYNQTMQVLREMEKREEVFFIQPEQPLKASRIEKDHRKLEILYMQGYTEAEKKMDSLKRFLDTAESTVSPLSMEIVSS
ncbi:patatin-like phospholipase family protein [Oceanobacillus chungangensis]|uniref:Patatin family protein n=1 Tax=Oceanobacillus chungangensis TaxID=1229152 RepID=A0A3D8PLU4_9BACI|nr:patatin family protein [Oceanobacillus chungangensis]RDW16201.1 patatin family protein [Oceanobacillus chungangensis]